jgi:hypothetical protein
MSSSAPYSQYPQYERASFTSNDGMINDCERFGTKQSQPKYCTSICLEGLKKTSQAGRCPDRNLNPCTREIKSRIAMAKTAFNKKKNLFTNKLDLNLRKKLVKCYIWSIALCGAETWTLRKVDQKYLESF